MIPTAVLTKLATLGLNAEQAEAVAGMLSAVETATKGEADAVIEKSREKVRVRVQKWRAKQDVTLPNVTERYVTAHASASPAPDLENKQTNKQENKGGRATRLTDDWQIPEEWIDEAIAAGMSRSEALTSAGRMKNWSISTTGAVKLDWHATWRNWFARDLKGLTKATGPPKPPTLASMWRDEGRKLGILPNEPPHEINGRLDTSFGDGSAPGSNFARRVASAGSG